jgi:hypothetical protein
MWRFEAALEELKAERAVSEDIELRGFLEKVVRKVGS